MRYEALVLLNNIMNLHRASIRSLGLESLMGILDLVAGERDPRNLMVVFSFLAVLISEWDISSRVEVRSGDHNKCPALTILGCL